MDVEERVNACESVVARTGADGGTVERDVDGVPFEDDGESGDGKPRSRTTGGAEAVNAEVAETGEGGSFGPIEGVGNGGGSESGA